MCEYSESSQLKSWLFTPESLDLCRARANRQTRKWLAQVAKDGAVPTEEAKLSNVSCFARNFTSKSYQGEDDGPWQSPGGNNPYLDLSEESLLVSFYVSKLPSLMGPQAQIPRLRRESKIPATAALLLRRFYLSNSVMVYDPKTIMVAAAFLAAKVEDAMTDVRYLEEGTNAMNAPVTQAEIIPAEIALLSGIHFDLLCFHPYKAVLAITEDLRTYLKSEKGRTLVRWTKDTTSDRAIIGQDLKPMHDAAQRIVNDVIVSDIPLLYTPGQVGLAALMVANEEQQKQPAASTNSTPAPPQEDVPQIDIMGYLSQRFQEQANPMLHDMKTALRDICNSLRQLKEGKHGCANHHVDMQSLKGIHKKLKKVRVWGVKEKKKKRKNAGGDDSASESKKAKTS
jgi:cyclin H